MSETVISRNYLNLQGFYEIPGYTTLL